jgi:hypothetical protein
MYWRNERHLFSAREIDFEGTIMGIDGQGQLEIESYGRKKYFGIKEIVYKS